MEKKAYERYGLTGNPFRDLASETIDNVDIFHVNQDLDYVMNTVYEEIVEKENKAFVLMLGGLGSGKTERLLLARNIAKENDVFCVYCTINSDTGRLIKSIMNEISVAADLGFFTKLFFAPKWYRAVEKKKRKAKKKYDPEKAGKIIADALNQNTPSFLLVNDLHNLPWAEDKELFYKSMYVLVNNIKPGVLVVIGSDEKYFEKEIKKHKPLKQRLNKTLPVKPLSDQEASLMIAKRMLAKRLVEDLEPIYPFTSEGISVLNREAKGNPRKLLRICDTVIDKAAQEKAINIDPEIVKNILNISKNKKLDIDYGEKDSKQVRLEDVPKKGKKGKKKGKKNSKSPKLGPKRSKQEPKKKPSAKKKETLGPA